MQEDPTVTAAMHIAAFYDVRYVLSTLSCAAATLEHAPGTAVELFVTFLTPALLARMHETEGAYLLCRLSGISLHVGASLESHRCRMLCGWGIDFV